MARLRPGVSARQAQAVLAGPFSQWARSADPKRRPEDDPKLVVREGAGGLDGLRRRYSKPLYILLTLVGLILSIACANIANRLLARAAARKREIALRLSLGAGRLRIIRQLLTESVLLAALGGTLGVAFAIWGIRFLTLLLANGRENFTLRAELNLHVLAVVAGLSLLTGMLFGLAPALQSTRMDFMPALKESRTGEARGHGFRRLSLSRILMISQIAVTLLILVAAGLFVRTLSNLASIQLGFNQENVLTFWVNARQAGHKDPEIIAFYNDLRTQFSAIPGVRAASLSNHSLIGMGTSGTGISVSGAAPQGSSILTIGAGFLATMQIPLLMAREIDERDRLRSPVAGGKGHRRGIVREITRGIVLARLCTAFAILALAIAGGGLYGTMSYRVARRTGEIGIRMALGAQRRRVVWMILREVVLLAAVGLAISVPTALVASKLVESFLFGMKPNDPLALIGSVITLMT